MGFRQYLPGGHRPLFLGGPTDVFADLNGSSHYFRRSNADFPEADINSDMTIQMWIIFDALEANKALVSKFGIAGSKSYLLRQQTGQLSFSTSDNGTAVKSRTTTNASLATGSWAHYAVTFDLSAGTAIFYKNGVALTDNGNALDTSIDSNSQQFAIGISTTGTNFDGSISKVAFFGDIRTPSEIAASAADPDEDLSAAGNIIGFWPFDDDADATRIDNAQGDNGRDLDLVGGDTTNYGTHTRTVGVGPA